MTETFNLLNSYCYYSKDFNVVTERISPSKFELNVVRNSDSKLIETVIVEDIVRTEFGVTITEYAVDCLYYEFNNLKDKYIGNSEVIPCQNCKRRCSGCVIAE